MAGVGMEEFFAAAVRALVDAQLALDERGRDSFDAFDDTGVPPTVFTLGRCRLSCPVAVGVRGREEAGQPTVATLTPHGDARLALSLRYLLSPQGGDDPRPEIGPS